MSGRWVWVWWWCCAGAAAGATAGDGDIAFATVLSLLPLMLLRSLLLRPLLPLVLSFDLGVSMISTQRFFLVCMFHVLFL